MFGKKRTNLSVQTIESMAKIYRYALSTHDQKSLNHTGLISSNDIKQMLDNVFEEGDLFNEDDDNDELIQYEHEEETDINETLHVEDRIELGPWVLIENSSLPIITKKYDSEDDEDWNPDEMDEINQINNNNV